MRNHLRNCNLAPFVVQPEVEYDGQDMAAKAQSVTSEGLVLQAAKPILKWAGGKTQLLSELLPKVPKRYGQYIEPFFGGGALFFALRPERGIVSDSNPELINLYQSVASNVSLVIRHLALYKNTEAFFYSLREADWRAMPKAEAAARTLFLNRTCFNGLYRVNRAGKFNVPYGRYTNPKFLDVDALEAASLLLRKARIECGSYREILHEYATQGDFIFLDPPYLPIGKYSDFKRYTKEQFYEEDHVELSEEVHRLHELGCHVLLTNSNHPVVHEQYSLFPIDIFQTKRFISCDGKARQGEDVIVRVPPKRKFDLRLVPPALPDQIAKYPPTRYMGSKNKLLGDIWSVASQFQFENVIDLFSGSGVVSYMFKANGKRVFSNDYMSMSATLATAMVENNTERLSEQDVLRLLEPAKATDRFVETTFAGLYFSDEDNRLIDSLRANIARIKNKHKRAIASSALIRACFKKRPRGVFTYVGHRYDDGRKDLLLSFQDQFVAAVNAINGAVFDNGRENKSCNHDAMSVRNKERGLVYIDPPYYSPFSDNEYVRRYHFVEGIARDWKGVEIQHHTTTKKFKSYPTPFSSRKGAAEAFDQLFKQFRDSVLLVSYSSNSQPTKEEMVALIAKHKAHVEVVPVNHRYSFGNQGHKVGDNNNAVSEYLFVGY